MIDEKDEQCNEVVLDGIRFLESLTRYYGAERGMKVWEKMGEAMGQELQGQVFFAMLTGDTSSRVRISRGTCVQAVEAVKAIRRATGMGLKESKDAWDLTAVKTVTLENVQRDVKQEFLREIRNIGMRVH